jgi:hypothetical protein
MNETRSTQDTFTQIWQKQKAKPNTSSREQEQLFHRNPNSLQLQITEVTALPPSFDY